MKKNLSTIFIKCALVSLSIFLLGYLVIRNLVPEGRFEAVYIFKPTPFISALRPSERLSKFEEGHEQSIIGDPVYFDVRLPSSFENIELWIAHKNEKNQKFTIAAFTDRKNWQFRSGEVNATPIDNGLFEARANFFTEGLDIVNRTITFILGAPEASLENSITVYEITVVATKKPLALKQIPGELWKELNQAIRKKL